METIDRNIEEKSSISEELQKQTIDELIHIFNTCDENLVKDFFNCLFTPNELKDLANRWLLVKEIDKGTPQRAIAKKFSMSLCKITRGSRELNKPDSAFRKILDLKE
ncbi:MAG: trp operon repressor [Treponema sp.]|nr:trp operon repressor [Treponema sp.]